MSEFIRRRWEPSRGSYEHPGICHKGRGRMAPDLASLDNDRRLLGGQSYRVFIPSGKLAGDGSQEGERIRMYGAGPITAYAGVFSVEGFVIGDGSIDAEFALADTLMERRPSEYAHAERWEFTP